MQRLQRQRLFSLTSRRSSDDNQAEIQLTSTDVKDQKSAPEFPNAKYHAGLIHQGYQVFLVSDIQDEKSKENKSENKKSEDKKTEAKHSTLLICSKEGSRTIPLTANYCHLLGWTDDLILCGNFLGSILVINVNECKQVGALQHADDLSLARACVVSGGAGVQKLICARSDGIFMRYLSSDTEFSGQRLTIEAKVAHVCASLQNPMKFAYFCSRENQFYFYHDQDSFLQEGASLHFPKMMTFGKLVKPPIDAKLNARPEGGFILRDRKNGYIGLTDENGNLLADWSPDKVTKELLSGTVQIAEVQVLCDGDTFLLNFADHDNAHQIGVIRVVSPSNALQLTFEVIPYSKKIWQLLVDEENQRLIVISMQNEVDVINQFKPLVQALEKEAEIRQTFRDCGLTAEPVITLVRRYCG